VNFYMVSKGLVISGITLLFASRVVALDMYPSEYAMSCKGDKGKLSIQESVICSNIELRHLDELMGYLYGWVLEEMPGDPEKNQFTQSQRLSIEKRASCSQEIDCLTKYYADNIARLVRLNPGFNVEFGEWIEVIDGSKYRVLTMSNALRREGRIDFFEFKMNPTGDIQRLERHKIFFDLWPTQRHFFARGHEYVIDLRYGIVMQKYENQGVDCDIKLSPEFLGQYHLDPFVGISNVLDGIWFEFDFDLNVAAGHIQQLTKVSDRLVHRYSAEAFLESKFEIAERGFKTVKSGGRHPSADQDLKCAEKARRARSKIDAK